VVGVGSLILSRRKSRTAVYDGDVVERRGLGGRVGLAAAVVALLQAGEVDNLMLLVGEVDIVLLPVGEEGSLDMAAGAHHLQAAPFVDDDDPLCGCRDSRDSLSGCLFQAPISVCRSRSSQSDKWDAVVAAP